MKTFKKYIYIYVKKKKRKRKENPAINKTLNQTEKPKTKEKKKRKKKRKERKRQDRESERPILLPMPWRHCPRPRERDLSCYPVPTPPSAVAYPNRRPILPPPSVARSTLPSPISLLHCSSLHSSQEFNLSFPSKPNIMFVNLACCSVVCLLNTTVKQFTLTN